MICPPPPMDGVLALSPVYRPILRAGNVESQGDAVMQSDQVRSNSVTGEPVLVGVLSDPALNMTSSQSSNDLPAIVDRYLGFPATDEGRAMLEIVHEIAPGARLAHHSGILSQLSFAEGIRQLVAARCKVIVEDLGYPLKDVFSHMQQFPAWRVAFGVFLV